MGAPAPFADRSDAGRRLAAELTQYTGQPAVVLALPRGGVPVAAEIAAALKAPIDLVLVRKIGVPYQPELAMGAVVDGAAPLTVRNEDVIRMAGVDDRTFDSVRDKELDEIKRRRARYLGQRRPAAVKDRVAIVVDDGIATGATVRAALQAVRSLGPKKLVLAVPVAAADTIDTLAEQVDEVVCLVRDRDFDAIGAYYIDFRQVSDEEVLASLARFPAGEA